MGAAISTPLQPIPPARNRRIPVQNRQRPIRPDLDNGFPLPAHDDPVAAANVQPRLPATRGPGVGTITSTIQRNHDVPRRGRFGLQFKDQGVNLALHGETLRRLIRGGNVDLSEFPQNERSRWIVNDIEQSLRGIPLLPQWAERSGIAAILK